MEETTGSTAGSKRATAELALSDEQRGRIYEGVMRIRMRRLPTSRLPRSPTRCRARCRCRICPPASRGNSPVQGHKFVKFDDRIVVVDPKSRVVVAMIPRYKLLP